MIVVVIIIMIIISSRSSNSTRSVHKPVRQLERVADRRKYQHVHEMLGVQS